MHRNLAFLKKLPGFMGHTVFEKTHGPTTFDIVTIAAWESREAIDAASTKVRRYYQEIGFDMPAVMRRLGIVASLGYYRAPAELRHATVPLAVSTDTIVSVIVASSSVVTVLPSHLLGARSRPASLADRDRDDLVGGPLPPTRGVATRSRSSA